MTGVVHTHWEIPESESDALRLKQEMFDRILTKTVREFMVYVGYQTVSFNVDLRYTESDRHAEVTAYATETRKVRFEKS